MDSTGFDTWTRRRFGVGGAAAAALVGLAGLHSADAKKHKKKKKKKNKNNNNPPANPDATQAAPRNIAGSRMRTKALSFVRRPTPRIDWTR